jgi:hypothetical protein
MKTTPEVLEERAVRLGFGTVEKMQAYYAKRRKDRKTSNDYAKR